MLPESGVRFHIFRFLSLSLNCLYIAGAQHDVYFTAHSAAFMQRRATEADRARHILLRCRVIEARHSMRISGDFGHSNVAHVLGQPIALSPFICICFRYMYASN